MLPLNSQGQGLIPVTILIKKFWCYITFWNTLLDSCTAQNGQIGAILAGKVKSELIIPREDWPNLKAIKAMIELKKEKKLYYIAAQQPISRFGYCDKLNKFFWYYITFWNTLLDSCTA